MPSLDTSPPLGFTSMTILLASLVGTLVSFVVKYSRPPDLKSSSNVSSHLLGLQGPQQLDTKLIHLRYFDDFMDSVTLVKRPKNAEFAEHL